MTTSSQPLLRVDRLHVDLAIEGELRPVIHDVSFELSPGQALGLVGESGSGKSMTARSVMRLLPPKAVVQGRIEFDGADVLTLDRTALRQYYTREVAMIFQDPSAHINPVRTIGAFLTEAMRTNLGHSRAKAEARAVQLLDEVGIPEPRRRLRQYPHELSGGLLQRVMIASALALEPRLLIADEPTTALDVTRQMEVMAILEDLRAERSLAMLFITHDLDLAEAICDQTAVMYAGSIVERQPTTALHAEPLHPYTRALIGSRPDWTVGRSGSTPSADAPSPPSRRGPDAPSPRAARPAGRAAWTCGRCWSRGARARWPACGSRS
ncbi:ABC transporter ATP-binding protein [Nocardioides humi]|uniref:ABC transporter ATP-binding protein n=1 Tax=Nocardioides humi TaxID=449461 RepID=UPI001C641436|nr:ABC transporter ATP-binding protein [Nocardioides humi]